MVGKAVVAGPSDDFLFVVFFSVTFSLVVTFLVVTGPNVGQGVGSSVGLVGSLDGGIVDSPTKIDKCLYVATA